MSNQLKIRTLLMILVVLMSVGVGIILLFVQPVTIAVITTALIRVVGLFFLVIAYSGLKALLSSRR